VEDDVRRELERQEKEIDSIRRWKHDMANLLGKVTLAEVLLNEVTKHGGDLMAIKERLDNVEEHVQEHSDAINGNGNPGLKRTVATHAILFYFLIPLMLATFGAALKAALK
jgi:hypothetical protein